MPTIATIDCVSVARTKCGSILPTSPALNRSFATHSFDGSIDAPYLEKATVGLQSVFDALDHHSSVGRFIMEERRGAACLTLSLIAALCACGTADDSYGADDELEFRTDDGGVPATSGRPGGSGWLSNGLESPNVSGIDPAYGLDTPQGMSQSTGLLTNTALLGTAEYLVECALPLGESITKTVGGQTLEFEGLLGLAPEWADGACDEECQQWVSACLLARTNVSGQSVMIWIRSDHPAIGYDVPDDLVREASWYGNLFAGPEEQYLCKGAPSGPAAAMREGRTCVLGQGCGFTKYQHCDNGRCTMAGPNGDVPTDCEPDGAGATHYATITTYVEG